MLRLGTLLSLVWVLGCGDDDEPADTGVMPVDVGGGIDTGTPVDSGGGTDTGGSTSMCPAGACDILTNAGCAAGQGCYLGMMDGAVVPICVPAGTGTAGTACAAPNDCMEGLLCDPNDMVCRNVCCIQGENPGIGCPTGELCSTSLVDEAGAPTGVGLCTTPDGCDLLAQTGCDMGEGCYAIAEDGSSMCAQAGTKAEGDACDSRNDCAPGHICVQPAGSTEFVCAAFCALPSGDPACGTGFACARFGTFPATIGLCAAMMMM